LVFHNNIFETLLIKLNDQAVQLPELIQMAQDAGHTAQGTFFVAMHLKWFSVPSGLGPYTLSLIPADTGNHGRISNYQLPMIHLSDGGYNFPLSCIIFM
jgi:hypothetical protein